MRQFPDNRLAHYIENRSSGRVNKMEEIKTWWEICQIAGAGAALVLGPVSAVLWRSSQDDKTYMRKSNTDTLTVLNELTKVLEKYGEKHDRFDADIQSRFEQLQAKIDQLMLKIDTK